MLQGKIALKISYVAFIYEYVNKNVGNIFRHHIKNISEAKLAL